MSEIRVRRLVYSDLPAVLAIERRSFTTPWSLAMFVLELSKPSGICLAAADRRGARRLPGLLALRRRLAPDERRGDARSAAARASRTGCSSACSRRPATDARYTLEVRTSNHGAIAMYERFGFRRAGHRRRYYHDNGEDALIMWLEAPTAVEA